MLSVTEGRLNVEKYFRMKNIPDDVIVLPAVRGVIDHLRARHANNLLDLLDK